MLITTHVLAGAAVFSLAPNPTLGVSGAFVSHFVLDAIANYDPDPDNKRNPSEFIRIVVLDIFASLTTSTFVIMWFSDITLIYGILAGVIMDIDIIFHLKKSYLKPFPAKLSKFHKKIQNETPSLFYGLGTQVLTILVSIYLLAR